jgi:hypothetical protein
MPAATARDSNLAGKNHRRGNGARRVSVARFGAGVHRSPEPAVREPPERKRLALRGERQRVVLAARDGDDVSER